MSTKKAQRKRSGSYYTPPALTRLLVVGSDDHDKVEELKAAGVYRPRAGVLTQVIHDRIQSHDDPELALLETTVVDPACGAGAFPLAALETLAAWLVMVRTGELDPPEEHWWRARRDIADRCIYAVDLNPVAVDLTRAVVAVAALAAEHAPNPFLAPRIRHGNALVGATPALLARGIPDEAFHPIEGDDKKVASALRKQNKAEREATSEGTLF